MTFDLFWIDFFIKDNLFGIGLFTCKFDELIRSLFSIYYNDGEFLIDLFWIRIYTGFLFLGWFYNND